MKRNKTKPTARQRRAFELLAEKGRTKGQAMLEAGYSEVVAASPTKVTESLGWKQLLDEYLPEDELAKHHKQLLNLTKIEHMVFPMATTDDEIKELIRLQGCEVKKIQHGDTATHVWYFLPDANAKKNALEMAYKMRGSFEKDNQQKKPTVIVNTEKAAEIRRALEQL